MSDSYATGYRDATGVYPTWIRNGREHLSLTVYALHRRVAEYRSQLPRAPHGTPNRDQPYLAADGNRKSRFSAWDAGTAQPTAVDAFAVGEIYRTSGVSGASGFTGLYLGGRIEDYLACLAVLWPKCAEAVIDIFYATPLAVDESTSEAYDEYLSANEVLQREARTLGAAAAGRIEREHTHLWASWPRRFDAATRVPAFGAALRTLEFDFLPRAQRVWLAFSIIDSWLRVHPDHALRARSDAARLISPFATSADRAARAARDVHEQQEHHAYVADAARARSAISNDVLREKAESIPQFLLPQSTQPADASVSSSRKPTKSKRRKH